MKRLVSVIMTIVLAISICTSALAGTEGYVRTTQISGKGGFSK